MHLPRLDRILLAHALAVVAVATAAVACDDKKKAPEAALHEDAGTDKYATADPKLEKALQAVASASPGGDKGPPPEGIFAPGAADARHRVGAPTKVDVASDGSAPRISLLRPPDASLDLAHAFGAGPAILEFGMQMGRTAIPTIDLGLVLGPSKANDGWLVADVRHAAPAKEQYGQLPPDTEKSIGTLAGTELRVRLTPNGLADGLEVQVGKSTEPELARIAGDAATALLLFTVPLPGVPIGEGAQWIAETRMNWADVDVIAYRAYRVKSIEGDRVSLTLTIQAYATNKDTQLQGVPKGATLAQFDAEAQGEVEVVPGEPVPRKGALQERLTLVFQSAADQEAEPQPGQPPGERPKGNLMAAKFQGEATLLRGDDLRAALAR